MHFRLKSMNCKSATKHKLTEDNSSSCCKKRKLSEEQKFLNDNLTTITTVCSSCNIIILTKKMQRSFNNFYCQFKKTDRKTDSIFIICVFVSSLSKIYQQGSATTCCIEQSHGSWKYFQTTSPVKLCRN